MIEKALQNQSKIIIKKQPVGKSKVDNIMIKSNIQCIRKA